MNASTIQAPQFGMGQRVSYRLDDGHVQHGTVSGFSWDASGWRYVVNIGWCVQWVYEHDLEVA